MRPRRKRFELMVVEPSRHRLLVGEDIGDEQSSDLFLCLPGLLETRGAFDEFVRHLAPRARIMTIDWCGRGDSQKLDNAHDYRMSVYLSDLALVYAHAMGAISGNARETPARIHLVGTSMGGLLAIFLAIHKPRHLGTVILNDVGPLLPWSGVFSLMTGMASAKSADLQNIADFNAPNLAEKLRVDPLLLRAVRQPGHLDLPHETRLSGVDFSDAFSAVTAPILLLRGAGSEIINDSVVKRIFELHPLTRIHECKESGHPVTYSAEVCAAILKFVSQH